MHEPPKGHSTLNLPVQDRARSGAEGASVCSGGFKLRRTFWKAPQLQLEFCGAGNQLLLREVVKVSFISSMAPYDSTVQVGFVKVVVFSKY